MKPLRRVLYLQAGVWALLGVILATAPRFVLVTVFDQPDYPSYAWLRLLGIQSFGLSLLMVLVAHRAEEVWWWSWAFALMTVGMAAVLVLNTAFGLDPGESSVLWWLLSVVTVAFALGLLYGLYVASQENPLP